MCLGESASGWKDPARIREGLVWKMAASGWKDPAIDLGSRVSRRWGTRSPEMGQHSREGSQRMPGCHPPEDCHTRQSQDCERRRGEQVPSSQGHAILHCAAAALTRSLRHQDSAGHSRSTASPCQRSTPLDPGVADCGERGPCCRRPPRGLRPAAPPATAGSGGMRRRRGSPAVSLGIVVRAQVSRKMIPVNSRERFTSRKVEVEVTPLSEKNRIIIRGKILHEI
jgi:hypothetical protein